jgi:hypothetical protein
MKKLFVIALLLVGTTIFAQERNRKHQGHEMEQFTPEQQSQLMLKKMTLDLDLNDSQQKEMSAIFSEKIAKVAAMKTEMKAKKEKGVRPTKDERFEMAMKMLDEQIATKKRVEKILNAKQFEKWSTLNENHKGKRLGKRHGDRENSPKRQG